MTFVHRRRQFQLTPVDKIGSVVGRWRIACVVSLKSGKTTMGNNYNFSVALNDQSARIHASIWCPSSSDFFPQIEEGAVYHVSGDEKAVKSINLKYNTVGGEIAQITLMVPNQR